MKKVGIMSMQRIVNYGSFLQAYGLKKIIEFIGEYAVEFVDYEYEGALDKKKESKKSRLKRHLNPNYIPGKVYTKKCAKKLKNDLKNIGVDEYNYHPDIDTLVIGSDEVFNCIQGYPVGYSKELFGKNYEEKNVISYAASFGYTTAELLEKYGVADEVSNMLSKFYNLSVRDQNSFDTIKKLTNREAQMHLDPVLMYDFKMEMKKYTTSEEGYIIVYAYTNRLSKQEEKYIKTFAKKYNKKIYSVGNYNSIADKNIICNPLKVFSLFRNADYIITDTFHGTIFSIKTNSKFCTIVRESNKNKLKALLSHLKREDRVVNEINDIEKLYDIEIDYHDTNEVIKRERKRTVQYLKENL